MLERDILNSELERIISVDHENPNDRKRPKKTVVVNHPAKVNLTIKWTGVNQGLLDANVVVMNGKTVLNTGDGNGTLTLEVDWAKEYRIIFTPKYADRKNDDPDRMYDITSVSVKNKASAKDPDPASMSVVIPLKVNRWNKVHVEASWKKKKVNKDLARAISSAVFLGQNVQVNDLTVQKLKNTELAIESDKADYKRIFRNIARIGSKTVRTQTGPIGAFSNHSLGCALDVNANEPTKQNHHFINDDEQGLLKLVQHVVSEQVPAMRNFDIRAGNTGLAQLDASDHFAREFPVWLYKNAQKFAPALTPAVAEAPAIRSFTDNQLQSMINNAKLQKEITLMDLFVTIKKFKKVLIAWEEGTNVKVLIPKKILQFIQAIVHEQVPRMKGYDVFKDYKYKTLSQLDSSTDFMGELSNWLYKNAQLLIPDLIPVSSGQPAIRDYSEEQLKTMITNAGLKKKKQLQKLLGTFLQNRKVFFAWAEEGRIIKEVILKGMISLDRRFIKIMTDNRWQWGGDYEGLKKDYMHFEDLDAMKVITGK